MSEIRVTYSGLISLGIGFVGIFSGLIFTLIITRTLLPEEYGTWGLITGLFTNVIIFEPVLSYWATREIARGMNSGKTAILSSGLFSLVGMVGYISIVFLIRVPTHVELNILFFGAILIPVIFLNRTLNAITLGIKPHAISIGQLFFGLLEIPLSLVFVYFLHMEVVGVIITVTFAYVSSIMVQIYFVKDRIKIKFNKDLLKKWLKLSWLPIYQNVAGILLRLDVVIFSIITGSVIGLAFWNAALAISQIITIIGGISFAAYPKLLQSKNNQFLQNNLSQFFYFATPFVAIAFIFAKKGLFILNPAYEVAVPVVIILTIQILLNTLSGIFGSLLSGTEKVDIDENSTFKDYVKSKLFYLPTLYLLQYTIYIITLTSVLLLYASTKSYLILVIYWSIILLVTQIPFTIYFYILVKKSFHFQFNISRIVKYVLVGIGVFGLIYLLSTEYLEHEQNLYNLIFKMIIFVMLGLGIYSSITYFLDSETKNLFNSILKEIRNRNHD